MLMGIVHAEPACTLRIGTCADYAPFTFVEQGQLRGFEIDMGNEVCKRLEMKSEWHDRPFDLLLSELRSGELDLVAAGMSSSPERKRVVDFSVPYIEGSPTVCFFPTGREGVSLEALREGKFRAVVNTGYIFERFVVEDLHLEPLRLETAADAVLAIQSGQADCYITSESNALGLKSSLGEGWSILECSKTLAEDVSMLLPKDCKEMQELVNKALREMMADGTVQAFRTKWRL